MREGEGVEMVVETRDLTTRDGTTPRPWTHRPNHKPYHIVVFGGQAAYRAGRTTGDILRADAALIVEAVNAYDRLRRIEAVAQAVYDMSERVRNGDAPAEWLRFEATQLGLALGDSR